MGSPLLHGKQVEPLFGMSHAPDTYAVSHTVLATREAGAMATSAEVKKNTKYGELARTHHVAPLAVETSGMFGPGVNS